MVYPAYPDTFWSFRYAMKFVRKKASFPPLGLLTVASLLPDEHEIRLVDMNVRKLKDKDLEWADIVFLSAMEVQKESLGTVIDRCRSMGKKMVAGGPLFTLMPDHYPEVDHLVLDEAETTIHPFLKDLESGNPKRIYTSKKRPEMNKVPIPSWDLIDQNDYATMLIQYSRGCPFNCEFCDISILNGSIPRTKSPHQIIDELNSLYEMGWRKSVFFVDDNFIGNKKDVKEMLPHLVRWQKEMNYPFSFLTEASMNLADDEELMDLMARANFKKVFLGIETPNMDSLKECRKLQNVNRDLKSSIRKIQGYGMEVIGGFIVGFDNDNESIFQNQIDFIQDSGIVIAMVGLLNAIPHTDLWKRLKKEGRLHGETSGSNTDGTINFIPRMGKKKLIEGYLKIISDIYSPKEYYRRIDIFLKYYKTGRGKRIHRSDVIAFLRSLWKIGFFSKARFHYWRLVLRTLTSNRKSFSKAMELAIMGYHFQKIAGKMKRHQNV